MATTTTKAPAAPSVPTFPAQAVATCLQEELVAAVRGEAARKGRAIPSSESALTSASIFIDSLAAVETLCTLDDVLPFEVDESVVRAGGYESIKSAVEHIVSGIEVKWNKYHTGGKP